MTQYNNLNVEMSHLQINKLKSEIKNGTDVTLKLSSTVAGHSNDENNFLHKFLLTNTQVPKFPKGFASGSSTNTKLSKTQLHIIGQSGGFLGTFSGPLRKTGLPLMKNILKQQSKSVLIPLRLTAAVAATDAAVTMGYASFILSFMYDNINNF